MVDELHAWLYGRHVADLDDNGDGLVSLTYTDTARDVGAPARLSLALAVREQTHPALRGATRWAQSLLPEGRALDAVVQQWHVPADDTFALLSVVGRDVAGAATILQPGEDPDLPDATYEPLDDDALDSLVEDVTNRPLGLDPERGVRLSLAGLQDKVVLHQHHRSRQLARPINGAPSTVIVKPEPAEAPPSGPVDGLATNELFGLTLARTSRIPAAGAYVRQIAGRPALVVHRYDRTRSTGDAVTRLHQEDLLMALGRDHRLRHEAPQAIEVPPSAGSPNTARSAASQAPPRRTSPHSSAPTSAPPGSCSSSRP